MKSLKIIVCLNIILLTNVIHADHNKYSSVINDTSDNDFNSILPKSNVTENDYHEDMYLHFPQLVNKYGYPVEEHEVKTSDGYKLTMFRIPKQGPAVLLIHGALLSSDDFVTIGPQAGLAYQLADAGYDVWLGNCRGNKYSIHHVKLSTSSAEYWDFTFDEMGRYDMPALIDYILKTTNARDLKLITHSLSACTILVLCSEKPQYNDKISVAILLSPTVFETYTKVFLGKLLAGPLVPNIHLLAKKFGIFSMFTDRDIGPLVDLLKYIFCATPETAYNYCHNFLFLLGGSNRAQVNKTSLPIIYGHFPTSISTKTLQHVIQLKRSGKFRRYDFGKALNFLNYGSLYPPEYRLKKVTTKVAIAWADNDWFCVEEDLKTLLGKLPNVVEVYKVPDRDFNHADYLFARDVKSLLYYKVLDILNSY